jgi:hypothetical protein
MIRNFVSLVVLLGLLHPNTIMNIAAAEEPTEQCNKTKVDPKGDETPRLGLPAGSSDGTQKLVLGESYNLFDKMGPLIINDDGSTRRIANWDVLTERERQTTLRVLSKRNKVPIICFLCNVRSRALRSALHI